MDVAIKFLIQKKKITVILSEANPISKFKTPVSNGRSLCLDTKVTPHASTLVIWNAKVKVKNRLSMSRPKHEYKRGKSLKFWWHEIAKTKLGVYRWTYKTSYIRTSEIIEHKWEEKNHLPCTALKMWAFHRSILSIALLMSCSIPPFRLDI